MVQAAAFVGRPGPDANFLVVLPRDQLPDALVRTFRQRCREWRPTLSCTCHSVDRLTAHPGHLRAFGVCAHMCDDRLYCYHWSITDNPPMTLQGLWRV